MAVKDFGITRKEAAAYLSDLGYPMTAENLGKLASNNNKGKGPPFTRIGWKHVRYAKADLDAWAAKRIERVG